MIISLNDININVNLYPFSGDDNFVFLLHGFTGSGKDWENVVKELDKSYNYITVDLPGHGLSESPNDVNLYTPDALSEQINDLISHFTRKKIILCGYSMGGRAALLFSTRHPEKVKGLVLESASPGIKDENARKLRKADDENLAEYIEKHTIEEFVNHWMNIDIFKTQENIPKKLTSVRSEKMNNSKTGLSNSLRGFSTGNMPYLFYSLRDLQCKTLLLSGELDFKYTQLNREMALEIPYCRHIIVPETGHNIHLENSEEFINILNKFLSSF